MIDQLNQPITELVEDQQHLGVSAHKKYLLIAISIFIAAFLLAGWWFLHKLKPGDRYDDFRASELQSDIGSTPTATSNPLSVLLQSPTPVSNQIVLPATPFIKNLGSKTHIFQSFNNCGPASLSMALSHYGITATQLELGLALRPYQQAQGDNDDKSVTLSELAAKAKEYGFEVYHRPAGNFKVLENLIAQDLPVITRTWLKPGEDIGHYRVVTGYDQDKKQLIQDDSLQGKQLSYSYDEFDQLWQAFNYEFLVLVPKEKVETVEKILDEINTQAQAWQTALMLAEQQLENDQSNIYAQFNKSVALYHLGQHEESIDAYEKVATKLPSRMLWYQIEPIMAYYKVGNFDKVIMVADQILNHDNRAYSELYQLKGLIYEEQGNKELAKENFDKATIYNTSQFWKVNIL